MEEITFDLQQVAEQIRHAMSCTEWKQTYGQTDERAGLWWVKDSGTYLMSNGINGAPRPEVAYAHDLGADADWDLVQDVCGGDDFAEYIGIDEMPDSIGLWLDRAGTVTIRFDEFSLDFSIDFTSTKVGA
jgi:hypothetical protein